MQAVRNEEIEQGKVQNMPERKQALVEPELGRLSNGGEIVRKMRCGIRQTPPPLPSAPPVTL